MNSSPGRVVTFGEGKTYVLDEYGFLDPPEQWDEEFAEGMAPLQGIYDGLTKEHWDLLLYIRRKVSEEEGLPLLVVACADIGIRLNKLKALFPTGYFRGACRLAGLSYRSLCQSNIWHTYETAPPLMAEYEVTPQGFLKDFTQWNERFAHLVSEESHLRDGLTAKHWEVIRFLRNYYAAMRNIPTIHEVCAAHHVDLEEFTELFPEGYRRGACRIAGLPFFG